MKIDIQTSGLDKFAERMERFPAATRKAAVLSINKATRRARTAASREIRKQVSLTAGYLNKPERLWISRYARETNLTARISARQRPTSLVTYGAKQLYRAGKRKARVRGGISVKVKRGGGRRKIKQAFFIRLKRGTEHGGNLGVAVRSLEGLNLKKLGASNKSAGIYTLYGPSIDQVFNTVRKDISPEISKYLVQEFNRQYARLL
ncbi:MAG: hypothetical protein DRQ98_10160 [Gammaproteobacteria bacterium]|nr:MAG: hypothetical protein DRQ98_10160 [Gammaproteobacteria bacterium]